MIRSLALAALLLLAIPNFAFAQDPKPAPTAETLVKGMIEEVQTLKTRQDLTATERLQAATAVLERFLALTKEGSGIRQDMAEIHSSFVREFRALNQKLNATTPILNEARQRIADLLALAEAQEREIEELRRAAPATTTATATATAGPGGYAIAVATAGGPSTTVMVAAPTPSPCGFPFRGNSEARFAVEIRWRPTDASQPEMVLGTIRGACGGGRVPLAMEHPDEPGVLLLIPQARGYRAGTKPGTARYILVVEADFL